VTRILVLANETIAGGPLLSRIRERGAEGAAFHVVVP
jgi:hypothetical protein